MPSIYTSCIGPRPNYWPFRVILFSFTFHYLGSSYNLLTLRSSGFLMYYCDLVCRLIKSCMCLLAHCQSCPWWRTTSPLRRVEASIFSNLRGTYSWSIYYIWIKKVDHLSNSIFLLRMLDCYFAERSLFLLTLKIINGSCSLNVFCLYLENFSEKL